MKSSQAGFASLPVLIIVGIAIIIGAYIYLEHPFTQTSSQTATQSSAAAPVVNGVQTYPDGGTTLEATTEGATSTVQVPSQLPGAPAFSISYPSSWGSPVATTTIRSPGKISHDYNVGSLVFYKPNSPRTFPYAESETYLVISIGVDELQSGQTFQQYAENKFPSTDTQRVSTPITVDGHPAYVEKSKPADALTFYEIDLQNGNVLELYAGQPQGSTVDTGQIIESVKF